MVWKNCGKHGRGMAERVRRCFRSRNCVQREEPLSDNLRTGRIRVCKITGDRKVCGRMASMGIYPGVEADIICPENGGQCILKVQGGTISLDSEVSQNILVCDL